MTIFHIVIISAMSGALLTTGAILAIENRSKQWEKISTDQSQVIKGLADLQGEMQKGKIDLQKNLTAPDLIEVPCSEQFIDRNGEGLCREMFCRLQTREGDGASQSECEEIANLNNTISILSECKNMEVEIDQCIKVLDTRK
jgi:hypothetical protein